MINEQIMNGKSFVLAMQICYPMDRKCLEKQDRRTG